jgi:glycosyltransferase involved in cell wall biosynthesis
MQKTIRSPNEFNHSSIWGSSSMYSRPLAHGMMMLMASICLSCGIYGDCSYYTSTYEFQPEIVASTSSQESNQTYDLTIAGRVLLGDGIGKQGVDLIQTMGPDFKISFIHTGRVRTPQIQALRPEIQRILELSGIVLKGRVLILEDPISRDHSNDETVGEYWREYGLPEEDPHQIRIAYSMIESSKIPRKWVSIINHRFDAVAVPDPFLVSVYEASGVTVPIFVVPLGRDLSAFLDTPLKISRNTPFVFATFNTCERRKNTLRTVQGFARAFGNNPNVELHLGWRCCRDKSYRQEILDEIARLGLTNVLIEEGSVDFPEHYARFCKIDCHVSLSTGEGFSILPREAMALGIPVIVSDNTGQTTICDSGLVRTVPSNIEVPAMYPWPGDFGVQYDCLLDDIAAAYRDVYEHYEAYIQNASEYREWARKYDLPMTKDAFMSLIKPARVVVGKTNTILPGGLMTTSTKLAEKYMSIFSLPTPESLEN